MKPRLVKSAPHSWTIIGVLVGGGLGFWRGRKRTDSKGKIALFTLGGSAVGGGVGYGVGYGIDKYFVSKGYPQRYAISYWGRKAR